MKLSEKVLVLLEKQKGEFCSGQEIAEQLSVTRASIWKTIKTLQEEGYPIVAVTNKGYSLVKSPDILSAVGIRQTLLEENQFLQIETKKKVDSTNNELKHRVALGEHQDMVLVAEEQEAGRGRRGRSFFSPKGSGIYMSFLLHPQIDYTQAELLTTAAAVAVAEAIETVSKEKVAIKWVNDLWLRGKKISGILTEASTSLESGQLEYAIIGIGINVQSPVEGFPEELQPIAESIFQGAVEKENLRNQLVGEIINHFMHYYRMLPKKEFLEEYRNRSFVLGKEIMVLHANGQRRAKALEIDDHCHLKVQYEDGTIESLSSGEISIRV